MATENVDKPSAACKPETAADGYTIPAGFEALSAAIRAGTLAMPTLGGALADTDVELLSLYREYQVQRVAITQTDPDQSDENNQAQLDALGHSTTAIVNQIRNAYAESAMGWLVKLRIAVAEMYGKPENVFEELCADVALRMERELGQKGPAAGVASIDAAAASSQDSSPAANAFGDLQESVTAGTKTVPSLGPADSQTDGALRALWRRHQNHRRILVIAANQLEARDAKGEPERTAVLVAQFDSLVAAETPIREEIVAARAESFAGILIKLLAGIVDLPLVPDEFDHRRQADAALQADRLLTSVEPASATPDTAP